MIEKTPPWFLVLLLCYVSAQDLKLPTNNPYDPNINRYNPYTQEPHNGNGQFDQSGTTNRYNNQNEPRYNQNEVRYGQNEPEYGQTDLNGNKLDQNGFNAVNGNNFDEQFGRTPYNPYDYGGGAGYDKESNVIREATYFVVASKTVRPDQLYRVSVTVLKEQQPLKVRASISRNGVEMSSDSKPVKEGIPETLLMRVPSTSASGQYKLRVEGQYENVLGGIAFVNETNLVFSQRSMTIFIQLDKPVYMQGENVRIRTIPINTELKPFNDAIDVYMLSPNGHIMKRWLSRQSNLGSVSLEYQLSDQPVFGEWKIRVIAQGQTEESTFLVEEYYQTRFEVNVTMPAFFLDTDEYVYGTVQANYTSGGPVSGNLTIKATVRPVTPVNVDRMMHKNKYRTDNVPFDRRGHDDGYRDPNRSYDETGYYDNNRNPEDVAPVAETFLTFNEELPFWYKYDRYQYDPIPHLRFFKGVYEFRYPIQSLLYNSAGQRNHKEYEIEITATVGDQFLDEIIEGYSTARLFNSSIRLKFLGDSPQVFKPGMPVTTYIVASYYDGSPLPRDVLANSAIDVTAEVETRSGGRSLQPQRLIMMADYPGIWEYKVDPQKEFGIRGTASREFDEVSSIRSMRIRATFMSFGRQETADLLMLAHYSKNDQHIKIMTSTVNPRVGEYIIFHVRSNYYLKKFNYVIISKGTILVADDQDMRDYVSTMAIGISAEMAPVATIIVWHVGKYGDLTVDSLTFPVNGISRNKFEVFINNKKARTGHKVEVAIYGEPGSYVGISGIDRAYYTMQAGNELTYAKVIKNMMSFDENTNGTLQHEWFSHEGYPSELVYFPSSSYGIDANRTFEYAGLVVFSDFLLTRRPNFCNATLGYGECLNGRCFPLKKRCDFYKDCEDGTDEAGCTYHNNTELTLFRKFRQNRIQRQYENVWLWKDINIGPHGRYIFNVPVPERPVHWMVSAFSMSPSLGFGMTTKAIEYTGVLPFFINVEMPNVCMQGEQVGVRVTVFNYMLDDVEATVVLTGSPDYKFVHVEENGIVRSYNPRTSFGEHQFFVFIKAQETTIVYIPIVPTRLGDINVTVYASSLIGKDEVTRKLHVESDGIPQHRHQSVLLDLSNRAYLFQYMHLNITETPEIPYEYDRYYVYGSNKARISIVGDVVGPVFPTMPVNATSLLHLPMDSAEASIFSFAANMYTLLYMRYTQQRDKLLHKQAFHFLNVGYQRHLSFMQPDGSFSTFRSDWNQSASSVWLTAYSARILQEASFYEWENFIYIDPVVIAKSIDWVLQHQEPQGSFYETTWLSDRNYNTSMDTRRNVTLTAHVLITLESVKDLTSGLSNKVAIAAPKAVKYLEMNFDYIKTNGSDFEVAIVTYALTVSKASSAELAFLELSKRGKFEAGLLYWGRESIPQPPTKIENQKPFMLPRLPYTYDSENIEATAYALMVYVIKQEIYVENIVRWLNTQRLTDGGWASTPDTAHAMRGLIEYTAAQRIRDISSLSVTIEATSLPGQSQIMHVNDKNRAKLQYVDIPNAWGTVKVTGKGTGYAVLQMHVQYNVEVARFQTDPPVRAFELVTRPYFYGRNHSHITYESCQRWTHLNESERSGMAVLDVTIPTGYYVQQQDLDAYVLSRRVRNLQRAKYLERKVLFYFDYLDREDICVNFTVERWFPVANMSRYLASRVYDYYAPERFNETILDFVSTYALDICQVCGSSQCPYCWIYNGATKIPVPVYTILLTSLLLIVMNLRTREVVT